MKVNVVSKDKYFEMLEGREIADMYSYLTEREKTFLYGLLYRISQRRGRGTIKLQRGSQP